MTRTVLAIIAVSYLAGMIAVPNPAPVTPLTEIKYVVAPASISSRTDGKYRKMYYDRISAEPVVAVKVESVEPVKARPQAKRLPCKVGRTRNASGQCGRWK